MTAHMNSDIEAGLNRSEQMGDSKNPSDGLHRSRNTIMGCLTGYMAVDQLYAHARPVLKCQCLAVAPAALALHDKPYPVSDVPKGVAIS